MRELWGWTPWTAADLPPAAAQSFAPRFDVHETASELVFRADLPGIKQDNLEITLTANQLRIAGRREATKHEESERSYLANANTAPSSASSPCPKASTPKNSRPR